MAKKKTPSKKKPAPIKSKHDSRKNLFELENATVALTDRQKLFCMEYLKCKFNGTEAAKHAGYEHNSNNDGQAPKWVIN